MHFDKRLIFGAAMLLALPAVAQQSAPPPATTTTLAPRPGTTMATYPPGVRALNGQLPEQAQLDVSQCQNSATQASGFIPGTPPPTTATSQPQPGARVKGAAKGAAAGAVVGSVQNNQHPYAPPAMRDDHVGDSAVTGAVVGTMAAGSNQRQDRRKAEAEQKKANDAYQQKSLAYNNSYNGCLQGRGYALN